MWNKLEVLAVDLKVDDLVMDESLIIKSIERWADDQSWWTKVVWEHDVASVYDNHDQDWFTVLREVKA